MTTEAARKIRAKRARRPIYGVIEKVAVLETGEERLAIVAAHPIDRKLMAERGYRRGDEVRLEIKKARNVRFHRLAHAVGNLLVDHVEKFRHMTGHDALKAVQRESGVCCEQQTVDMGTLRLGELEVHIGERPVTVARSIAFDEMPEEEFHEFFSGITDYIDQHYASVLTDEVRGEYFEMVGSNSSRAA